MLIFFAETNTERNVLSPFNCDDKVLIGDGLLIRLTRNKLGLINILPMLFQSVVLI